MPYLFMKDKFNLSERTSFSRFSHLFRMDFISVGIAGVELLSFASAILHYAEKLVHIDLVLY